jgi:hypothetical protein
MVGFGGDQNCYGQMDLRGAKGSLYRSYYHTLEGYPKIKESRPGYRIQEEIGRQIRGFEIRFPRTSWTPRLSIRLHFSAAGSARDAAAGNWWRKSLIT